jgi:hypothetical protein
MSKDDHTDNLDWDKEIPDRPEPAFIAPGYPPQRIVPRHPPESGRLESATLIPSKEQLKMIKESLQKPISGQPTVDSLKKDMEELGEGADGGGLRYNKGKNRMDLTPPEWEWALADVTTQGSKKYDERNWEQGMKWSTMIGCMKRHLNKFLAGQRYDGDKFDKEKGTTGCHELAMVAWNALALMSYDLRDIGTNDLPKEVQLELFEKVNAETSDKGVKINE